MHNYFENNKIKLSQNFIVSLILVLVGVSYFIFLDFDLENFAYDEIFTIAMIKYSFSDIWQITATDVHPPLYYMMLKSFVLIFGNSLVLLRIFSALGVIFILLTGLVPVRKYFGEKVSLLFIILIIILPVSQYLVTEVRMYSWTMFFMFASALSAYRIFLNGKLINYISLGLFSLCSAYTHYFGLLGILILFITLLIGQIYQKKSITKTVLVFLIFLSGYSFWIPELYGQMSRVNTQYWINSPGLKDLLLLAYYTFSPKEPSHSYTIFNLQEMSIALSIMLLLISAIFIYTIRYYKKLNCNRLNIAFMFIVVALLPIFTSIMYSYLIKPIIVPRYITCYLGCIVLGLSMILIEIYNSGKLAKSLFILSTGMLLFLSIIRIFSERKYNESQDIYWNDLKTYIESNTSPRKVFLAPLQSSVELAKIEFLYPDDIYLIYSAKKTNYTTPPFKNIEVNDLPRDFDFYLVVGNNNYQRQTDDTSNFMNGIRDNYIITDSLVQKEKKIYRMKTIHREREMTE